MAKGNFAYSGDLGPGFWGSIDAACAPSPTGRQSPIDIDRVVTDPALKPLNLILPRLRVELSNTGYTIMGATSAGGALILRGRTYSLAQFHFHTLAEHTVAGQRGVMEMHLVFKDSDDDLAVVGVLYRIGAPDAFLEKLIAAGLPAKKDSPAVPLEELSLRRGLSDTAKYYTYDGSLTTPACSENVTWLVLQGWAELSPEQFEAFRTILGNDFRPLQARNGRVIRGTRRRAEDHSNAEQLEP